MTNPLTLGYFDPLEVWDIYLFGTISIIPLMIYLAFFTKDEGRKMGFVGWWIIKNLRRLKEKW